MTLILLLIIIGFESCENDDATDPYANCTHKDPEYLFTPEEKELIFTFPFEEGQEFEYQNQSGETITFTLKEIDDCPSAYYTPQMFFISQHRSPDYTFENYTLRFEINDNPLDIDYRNSVSYYFNRDRNRFYEGLYFNLLNNVPVHFSEAQSQNASHVNWNGQEYEVLPEFLVLDQRFTNVRKFSTNDLGSYNNAYISDMLRDVNIIYYAPGFGIVQFDNIDGESFKLTTDLSAF